jgi:ribosomal protein S18 acetylase RimI-like enzyme
MCLKEIICGDDPSSLIRFRADIQPADLATVQRLVQSSGFFSAAEVAIAVELVEERLGKGAASGYEFLLAECQGQVVGYTCFGFIPGTQYSYNLYWIVVDSHCQGRGIGKALLSRTEAAIHQQGGRRVYIETSSRRQYAPTQRFYQRCDYRLEAILEDFYAPGDGKFIYSKSLVLITDKGTVSGC